MIKDFFDHPMRIFFLISCFVMISGVFSFFINVDYIVLHKFLFLHILPLCAYGGFLMTALPDWCNYEKSLFKNSIVMFFIFLISLILGIFKFNISYLFISIFWLYLGIFSSYMMIKDKNTDSLSVLAFLFSFSFLEFWYFLSADEIINLMLIHLNMIAILIVGFRISVVIGNEAVSEIKDAVFIPNFIHKNLALSFIILYMFCLKFYDNNEVLAYISLGISSVLFAKLKELFYIILLKKIYILIYFFIILSMALGYFCIGISNLLNIGFKSAFLHILTICSFLGTIFLIFNVAGLRHSGQELIFSKLSIFSFLLIFLAGLIRSFLWNYGEIFYFYLPSVFVILASIFYFKEFFNIFKNNDFTADPS